MGAIADDGLADQPFERFGQRRVDVARALHRGADVLPGDHLVKHRANRVDARARVARLEPALQLGGEAMPVSLMSRHERQAGPQPRDSVRAWRDGGGMNVKPLAARVPLLEVEADGNDDGDGLLDRHASPLAAARVEQRAQRHRGGNRGSRARALHGRVRYGHAHARLRQGPAVSQCRPHPGAHEGRIPVTASRAGTCELRHDWTTTEDASRKGGDGSVE